MYWCRTIGELALYGDPRATEPLMRAAKPLAILVYLGLKPHREDSREHVVELFWPGTPGPEAHHALRQALYRLRQATAREGLVSLDDGTVRCADGVTFDWFEGERALAEGDNERARLLLRGNFLEGFAFPDLRELTDWAEALCTRFRSAYARAAEALVHQALSSAEPGKAVDLAEELAATNPLDERRVRLLMTALDKSGQARRALSRYAEFTSHVRAQLEDCPSADLRRYAEELEQSLTPVIQPAGPLLPFVGRSEAWAALDAGWATVEAGGCATILIEGSAGLGKTRLVEEFAARVRARGAAWISGKCYEIERGLPYAAIGELIRSARRLDDTPSPSPFPQLAQGPPEGETPLNGASAGELRLREEVASWLEHMSAGRPVFLTCDDIHWADEPSLQVFHMLSHRLAGSRVLIGCTYRPVELSPASRKFAVSLAGQGLGRLVTLSPLTEPEVHEILATLAPFDDHEFGLGLAAELQRHTGGNPLFLAELIEALATRGHLTRLGGRWKAGPDLHQVSMPNTIRTILTDRVDALPEHQRDMLELLTVVADTLPTTLAARALGVSEPAAEATLADLGRARLVRQLAPGCWEAAHDELRQLVYEAIPDDRRARLHVAVGTALETGNGKVTPGGAARLAHHFELGGESERARQYALVAAGEAAAVGASEARDNLLARAESLAPPRAPAPPATEPATPRRNRWVRWAAAAGLLLAAGGAAVVHWSGGAPHPPYAQGSLYVVTEGQASDGGPLARAYEVRWPKRPGDSARLQALERWPGALPPLLAMKLVRTDRQTHSKIVRMRDADTVQLTFGETDDAPALWSPDRRLIAVQKGWRTGNQYRFNLFVIDTLGSQVRQLTDGAFLDNLLGWSPDGTRILFQRTLDGRRSLLFVDADGGEPESLTDTLGLPAWQIGKAAFSPDGMRLALLADDPSVLRLLDIRLRTANDLPTCTLAGGILTWSPDGQWLAVGCRDGTGTVVGVISADGKGGISLLTSLPATATAAWIPTRPPGSSQVTLNEREVPLAAHQGRAVRATAISLEGAPLPVTLRWTVGDTTVGVVDQTGFVKARREGRTWVAASAGSLGADTAALVVTAAAVDTLLFEDWTHGIDQRRWEAVGDPAPLVVRGAGVGGSPAFLSNGDHNWPSGVLSLEGFDLSEGLTLEFTAQFRFTGRDWQELEAVLIPRDSAVIAGERRPSGAVARVWTTGPSPNYATGAYSCRSDWSGANVVKPFAPKPAEWHRFAVQIRSDGSVECYLDGSLQAVLQGAPGPQDRRVALYLGGRSLNTRIYHGPVLVTRGSLY